MTKLPVVTHSNARIDMSCSLCLLVFDENVENEFCLLEVCENYKLVVISARQQPHEAIPGKVMYGESY